MRRLSAAWIRVAALCAGVAGCVSLVRADSPNPVLASVFPPGARANSTVEVIAAGSALDGLTTLRFSHAGFEVRRIEGNQFSVTVSPQTPPGTYDVRTIGTHGHSSPRSFVVGNRAEQLEHEPNETVVTAETAPLDVTINGRIERPGDVDCFRFTARTGQRVVLECRAERIDSNLRAVLELYDSQGARLAVNRGSAGIDPLIDFVVPADGVYVVKLFDLTFAGSQTRFYRLDVDTGPRVEFAIPAVVERGKTTRVALYGRNLKSQPPVVAKTGVADNAATPAGSVALPNSARPEVTVAAVPAGLISSSLPLDRIEVDVTPANTFNRSGLRLRAVQPANDLFAFHYPGGHAPIPLWTIDIPAGVESSSSHAADNPQPLEFPCELSGQLIAGGEQDWYSLNLRRGEVLWLEALGEQLGSPVDLDLTILDSGQRELARFSDTLANPGGDRFPLSHLDPAGRWVAPADGRYLILIRNLAGGLNDDVRRAYRLSVRREEPDFSLTVVPRRKGQPESLNVPVGGREMLEVLAVRRRGLNGPIRIHAQDLPAGIHCPDVWVGAGSNRTILVVTADAEAFGSLTLTGHADLGGVELVRPVEGGTLIGSGSPMGLGRLTDDVPLSTTAAALLLLTASPKEGRSDSSARQEESETVVFQNGFVDLAVAFEQRASVETGPIHISGVGLPPLVEDVLVTLPAGQRRGWISFSLPESLPVGLHTITLKAETEATTTVNGQPVKSSLTLFSNPVTVRVEPSRMAVGVDPRGPQRIARGKIALLNFTTERQHGFIGKVHVELTAPGGVVGLRVRGVTLVGGTDSGVLQIIANDDAPLGRQQFLRLEAVGTVEDRPVYRAARLVELEVTE